jgi:hypothetical protein
MEDRDVFINCPFSADYQNLFEALLFTIRRSGFRPRCALENDDGGEIRFEKICKIIAECSYGVHDISKTEPDAKSGLPRFNMPLELGLFLGARNFGGPKHARKKALILDREPYRYQAFMSDISGQDIHSHGADIATLIERVASWLRRQARDRGVPGGRAISAEFARFQIDLPTLAASNLLQREELTFADLATIAAEWILADSGGV